MCAAAHRFCWEETGILAKRAISEEIFISERGISLLERTRTESVMFHTMSSS